MNQVATQSTFAPRNLPIATAIQWVESRFDVMNQRRKLRMLDDAALQDLGLSYKDALAESRKPFFL